MTNVTINKAYGGAGLGSEQVNIKSGLHRRWITTPTDLDLSGGGSTVELMVAHAAGRIQSVHAHYTEAVSVDGDGTIVCGIITYASGAPVTDADRFATAIPTVSAAIGAKQVITATATPNFGAGDIVTVAYTTKTGTGECNISVEYTIDDEGF